MRIKKIVSLLVVSSVVVSSFNTTALAKDNKNVVKSYVVISETGKGRNVAAYKLNSSEASQMERRSDIVVIEEEKYVYGSKVKERAMEYPKFRKAHKRKIEKRHLKTSDTEWNRQAIKADSIDISSDTSTITEPAINTESGKKVKIALIDSGIDYTSDIDVKERKNFVPGHDDVSIIYEDTCGHGTSVAGVIAAKANDEGVTGINPNVELYSAKVLDGKLSAPVSRVVDAIYWAIEKKVNIINISFGTTSNSEALRTAIKEAYDAGILIVAAAGNGKTIEYPAAYEEVIAVGATDTAGERSEGAIGADMELVAPGEQILSTGDFGGLSVSSGTSMAAPHVVGVASVLWEKDLTCSSDFIRQLLAASANLYGDVNEYGYGLVDLKYALEKYDEFKKGYQEGQDIKENVEKVEENGEKIENASQVVVFDDVNYVEGSWKTTEKGDEDYNHKELADYGAKGVSLTKTEIYAIKGGAVGGDWYMPGKTARGQFHGYYQSRVNGEKTYTPNYVGCYIYLTNVARQFNGERTWRGEFIQPPVPNYFATAGDTNYKVEDRDTSAQKTLQKLETVGVINGDGVYKTGWDDILEILPNNDHYRKLFVYGIALHTATDVFAHSTSKFEGGVYDPITHDNGADNAEYIKNRYECAQAISTQLVEHAANGTSGLLRDFLYVIKYTYNDTNFKVRSLNNRVKEINESYYEQYKTEFDKISGDTVTN